MKACLEIKREIALQPKKAVKCNHQRLFFGRLCPVPPRKEREKDARQRFKPFKKECSFLDKPGDLCAVLL